MINEHDLEAFDYYEAVEEFRKKMEKPIGKDLTYTDPNDLDFGFKLITEEYKEISDEMIKAHYDILKQGYISKEVRKNLLKELCDLVYVVMDMAATYKLPINQAFKRVHQSNLSKLGEDGKPVYREDGKVLKGPNYKPPVLDDIL